ncbi:unnamed protein product [Kuraishia capsulata CBS 1993]|uniref:Protein MON2 homolog n=1 Tax=Kuraishia capsulata CBS 1993 TaxID=1382522 RepID=W6MGW2_9ASCO|nr:uncharacterized protein KUCA_T00001088001 [Kuraishia capsulata CBS 1993]CDK25121.1 unnamed protein product [Kuraishia capsulata CBS 1993]
MTSVQQLSTELSNLISESKRRNPDIRHSSEFISPFLLACQSRNAKYSAIAVQCLNKLIVSRSLPVTKLDLVLDAFVEATHLAVEIQLKVLQSLPFFFQSYSIFINDEILSKLLLVCSMLQGSNKMATVVNTASATFLQLISLAFEKVNDEDKSIKDEEKIHQVPIDNNDSVLTAPCAYDAQRIFLDLCTLIEHHKPSFLRSNYITEDFGFELLESVIRQNKLLFLTHVELGFLLRTRVAPILLRFLTSSKDFTIMVRISRLIYLLISECFPILKIECEVILSLLTHILLKEAASPYWKKVLALEVYGKIFKDFKLVKSVFEEYDNNQEELRKQVINDYFEACLLIVNEHKGLLNTGEIIQPPPLANAQPQSPLAGQSQPPGSSSSAIDSTYGLSVQKASIKVPFIDSLDKQDPPSASETYILYLIFTSFTLFCEGICSYSLELSSNVDPEQSILFLSSSSFGDNVQMKANFEVVRNMVGKNFAVLKQLYEIHLYSTLDNELFQKLIRSLQKLCHATAILDVVKIRDEILMLISKSALNLTGKSGFQHKNLLSFSETIVGTISSTINHAASSLGGTSQLFYTRNVNSRNIVCFRVLASLGVSLGSVLKDKWKVIIITLQWLDYYLNGSSDFSKDLPAAPTQLTPQDMISIEHSKKKLVESINTQSASTFYEIVKAVVDLSLDLSERPGSSSQGIAPILEGILRPCSYNKTYYVDEMTVLAKINPQKFLIISDKNWQFVNEFYINLVINRKLPNDFRLLVSKGFDAMCSECAISGLQKETQDSRRLETEGKVLNALNSFSKSLTKLPASTELSVVNCETEIHLQTLGTLRDLVDRFGTGFVKYWDVVFMVLNTPFDIIMGDRESAELYHEAMLKENIMLVLSTCFETMKLILDEFLHSLPQSQIKVAIDCLFNFVCQSFDQNISFNAISYFWLISDYSKEKTASPTSATVKLLESQVRNEDDLVLAVSQGDGFEDGQQLFESLWVYLLLKLAVVSHDERTQVRNGSIQTFFSIVDSHGFQLPSWNLVYELVLEPVIISVDINALSSTPESSQKDAIESMGLVMNGLSKLYLTFFMDFSKTSLRLEKFWNGLISHFTSLLKLNWVDLDYKIFKSFNDVTAGFVSPDRTGLLIVPPESISQEFYTFWANVTISYNLTNGNLYQESLTALMESMPALLKIAESIMDLVKFERVLWMLNSCVRYPILPELQKDEERCTELQRSVIKNLKSMTFQDWRYRSLFVQQLNMIVILPFSTRNKIKKKLGDRLMGKDQIPSFVAVSYEAIELLKIQMEDTSDFVELLNDKCILKVYRALLEPAQLKALGSKKGRKALWMESIDTLSLLTQKVVALLDDSNPDNEKISESIKEQVWPLVLETLSSCLSYKEDNEEYESYDITKYEEIKGVFLPVLHQKSVSENLLEELISRIWSTSFLYAIDDFDSMILSESKSPHEVSSKLAQFDFNSTYGSTMSLTRLPRNRIATACLRDLIVTCCPPDDTKSTALLAEKTLPYFVSRTALVLRKFILDQSLLNREPLPKVQQLELVTVLGGLVEVLATRNESTRTELLVLYPLLVKCAVIGHKVAGAQPLLGQILTQFHNKQ